MRTLDVRYSDIDINRHVNSIKYMEHILDLFSREELERGLRRFEIAYKAESRMGDTLSFYVQRGEGGETDVEVRRGGEDVVCQARVKFNE